MTTQFDAVLLGCPTGHVEATTATAWAAEVAAGQGRKGFREHCGRCGDRLVLLKTVTIRLADRVTV